jgi:hypothetical protein
LLKWKGIDFKLISDMARFEGVDKENNENEGVENLRKENKRAGIDLLDRLYNNYGVTVRTIIFCGYIKGA